MSPRLVIPPDINTTIKELALRDGRSKLSSALAGVCVCDGSSYILKAIVEPRQMKSLNALANCPMATFCAALVKVYEERPELYDETPQTVLFRARTKGSLTRIPLKVESRRYSVLAATYQTDLIHCIFEPDGIHTTLFPSDQSKVHTLDFAVRN